MWGVKWNYVGWDKVREVGGVWGYWRRIRLGGGLEGVLGWWGWWWLGEGGMEGMGELLGRRE